ncbi:MAG: J domain-containing protein [Phormidesmis sp.]
MTDTPSRNSPNPSSETKPGRSSNPYRSNRSDRSGDTPFTAPSARQAQPTSYYELLGLKPNASVQDIRRAYRDLSKLYHPDTTELERAIAIVKFQALNEAYATLSSPEKRLTYDYKTGFSRISVMQPLAHDGSSANNQGAKTQSYASNAYLDPTDRPLSAGEFFALFILGITFVGCLLLVLMLSLTQASAVSPTNPSPATAANEVVLEETALHFPPAQPVPTPPSAFSPELPTGPWLVPKARKSFEVPPAAPSISSSP